MADDVPPSAAPAPDAAVRQARLRFTRFSFTRSQAGRGAAEVELVTPGGATFSGKASGPSTPLGDFKIVGDASLAALAQAVGGGWHLELQGVKPLRAFDANVVIVCVLARHDDEATLHRLVGSHLSDGGDPLRSTVVAILGATNRLLGNVIATR
jgi:hypothetical protein